MFDFAVIGAGMIGSSVAKYLAQRAGGTSKILLVGPDEAQRDELGIHGAFFDAGRIVAVYHGGKHWSKLSVLNDVFQPDISVHTHVCDVSLISLHHQFPFPFLFVKCFQDCFLSRFNKVTILHKCQ